MGSDYLSAYMYTLRVRLPNYVRRTYLPRRDGVGIY